MGEQEEIITNVSAAAFANYLIDEYADQDLDADHELTNLRINKLVYFAHGFYLALSEKPLLACLDNGEIERLEAWTYGPVVPSLYHTFKHVPLKLGKGDKFSYSTDETSSSGKVIPKLDIENQEIKKVIEILKTYFDPEKTFELVEISHRKNSPWETIKTLKQATWIPDLLIKDYFKKWYDILSNDNE